ncbi:hypothetical protein PENSPDRAFT_656480 [Peniophora sp. CONT]|nr:hypothetical protein PENSPDRAFT_656480 [Peniophora sp. CONT]
MGSFAPRKASKSAQEQEESSSSDEPSNETPVARAPPKARRALGGSDQPQPSNATPSSSGDATEPTYTPRHPSQGHPYYRLPYPDPGADKMPCMHTCGKPGTRCDDGTFPVKKDSWFRHVGSYSRQSHYRCHKECPGYQYLSDEAWADIEQRRA